MTKISSALLALALCLTPAAARAGSVFELSLGSGIRWQPSPTERVPTNVMLAAGYSMPLLKLELGALVNAADVKGYKSELDLRGMLVVKPPLFPVYGRATLGMSSLLHGPKAFTYGASLGARLGVMGLGAFAEVGAIAKRLKVADKEKDAWVAEGRLGVYWD